jgi:NADH-quinone oxidoreductase subunit A
LVFLFPWSVVFAGPVGANENAWRWFSGVEMLIFVFILAVGLAYLWAKGYLDWAKPTPKFPPSVRPRQAGTLGYEKYQKQQVKSQ